eukprot:Transcript_21548.p2 GENE.Transcript_21548~~Transcript_21548.p2  ORF type:complete len:427 (+),score=185.57 Transcript_21548:407-1687(+)
MERPIDEIPPPHWDRKAPTLRQHLERVAAERALPGGAAAANTRVERLKYMLQHTLGCPRTFETRREELRLLRGVRKEQVSDEEVTDSFVAEVAPGAGGALRSYLEHASLAALLGNTLFVHGAVDARSLGLVPADDTRFALPPPHAEAEQLERRFKRFDGVTAWVEALNAFLRRGLADHARRPHWDAARASRGGEALLAMQNRAAVLGRTVVSNCFADGGTITSERTVAERQHVAQAAPTDPLVYERFCADPRDAAVAAWLRRGGVRRLVVGHKPSGDSPAVLCSRYTGLEVISADLSYSDARAPDNRGAAVAGVLIRGESLQANHALVYGTLSDGRRHEARLRTLGGDEDGAGGDPYVGSEVGDGWWVKARCWAPSGAPSGATYLLAKGAGRKVEYRNVPVDEMERHVQIDLVEELPTGGESCASS